MEYRACVEELLFSSQVQHMKSIRHHPGVSCYEHSVFVSYVAWYLADRWGADARTAARAGLLHDLYLYDPRTLPSYRQCFAHPVAAAENAAALCGGLTAREKNCILAHMWPLTAVPAVWWERFSKLVGMGLYTALNYFGQRFFAFRKKNS